MPSDPSRRLTRGGSRTADRIAGRAHGPAGMGSGGNTPGEGRLVRKGTDGADVFGGDLAQRALKALGARAMTVDRNIIVGESFDASKPEDRALLEHEKVHLAQSGGVGENAGRDHEEVMARAVERMVLHQASGGMESHEVQHSMPGAGAGHAGGVAQSGGNQLDKNDNAAVRGYLALRARGMPHEAIVELLARELMAGMASQREQAAMRFSDKKGFL